LTTDYLDKLSGGKKCTEGTDEIQDVEIGGEKRNEVRRSFQLVGETRIQKLMFHAYYRIQIFPKKLTVKQNLKK